MGKKIFLFTVAALFVLLLPLLSQWLWQWMTPVLFPGAIKQGLVVRELPYKFPFVLCLLALGLGMIAGMIDELVKEVAR